MSTSPRVCAHEMLETVPLLMRVIRAEMRGHRGASLSVPQFRVLAFLNRHESPSLTDLAEHLGLGLPSASTLVDGLVERRLVLRRVHPADRRRLILALSAEGRSVFGGACGAAQDSLAKVLSRLTPAQRAGLITTMRDLTTLFAAGEAPPAERELPAAGDEGR